MWPKKYEDYPEDTPLVKEQIDSGKGIIGCEMHDLNGWGGTFHRHRKKKSGLRRFLERIFGIGNEEVNS